MNKKQLKKLIVMYKKIDSIQNTKNPVLPTEVDLELIKYHIEEILKRHTKQTQNKGIKEGKGYSNFQKLKERYGIK